MRRREVRFYGTFGPSCQTEEILMQLLQTGMTGIRLNLSHTGLEACGKWIENYQNAQKAARIKADLLIDLQGPELRLGVMKQSLEVRTGEQVVLIFPEDYQNAAWNDGLQELNVLPMPSILEDYLTAGQKVLINDGLVEIQVLENGTQGVLCKVLRGGSISSRKSIALEDTEISSPTLTKEDRENLACAGKYGVTEVMLPFVRGKEDVEQLRHVLDSYGLQKVKIFAKIENLRGVETLEEIMEAADAVVIARGDLGNAQPLWKLPGLQKEIAQKCNAAGCPFVVATQMLKTMVHTPVPTRAEVSDIYNAVLDGACVLLLTEETAVGEYPVEAMRYLVLTGKEAELKSS